MVEGSTGLTEMIFTVTLSNPSSTIVTVCYESALALPAGGSHSDFASVSYTLTFLPGQNHQTIRVQVVGDTVYEGDHETFSVMLMSPTMRLLIRCTRPAREPSLTMTPRRW